MSNEQGSEAVHVLLAFLLGATTGAAIALLYAPTSGKETRDFLSEKARQSRDKAAEAAQKAREAFNRQKESLGSAIERGREAYRETREGEKA
jgi:gas vesicle protein